MLKPRWFWLLALVLLMAAWFATPYPRGMLMARLHHTVGRYEIMTYGEMPPPEWDECNRLLAQRYDVRRYDVASCEVPIGLKLYADGYNSVSERLLIERHGKNIVEGCWEEAIKTVKE